MVKHTFVTKEGTTKNVLTSWKGGGGNYAPASTLLEAPSPHTISSHLQRFAIRKGLQSIQRHEHRHRQQHLQVLPQLRYLS